MRAGSTVFIRGLLKRPFANAPCKSGPSFGHSGAATPPSGPSTGWPMPASTAVAGLLKVAVTIVKRGAASKNFITVATSGPTHGRISSRLPCIEPRKSPLPEYPYPSRSLKSGSVRARSRLRSRISTVPSAPADNTTRVPSTDAFSPVARSR